MLNALKQINWLDIVVIILLIRIVYIAVEKGLLTEAFKLLGVLVAIILTGHYSSVLSEFISAKTSLSSGLADLISYLLLIVFGYLLLVVFRNLVLQLMKKEPASALLSKWIGGMLGVFRGILSAGLLISVLQISSVDYLGTSIKESFLASRFLNVTTDVYEKIKPILPSQD